MLTIVAPVLALMAVAIAIIEVVARVKDCRWITPDFTDTER